MKSALARQGNKLMEEETEKAEAKERWTYMTRLLAGIVIGLLLYAFAFYVFPEQSSKCLMIIYRYWVTLYHRCFASCGSWKRKLKVIMTVLNSDDTQQRDVEEEETFGLHQV